MISRTLFAVALALGFVSSQVVNPSGIPMSSRAQWCSSQTASCPLICATIYGGSQVPESNTCDPKTLSYSCVCANGQSPNATQYTQTIPYFICTEQNEECVKNCNGVQSCQFACRAQHPCGAQSPKRVNATVVSTTDTATATSASSTIPPSDVVYNGFGTGATAAATATGHQSKEGASPVTTSIDIGRVYGLFIVMGGILAGFGLLL